LANVFFVLFACICHSALLSHCFPSRFSRFSHLFFCIILIGGARSANDANWKTASQHSEWQVTRSGKKSNEIQLICVYIIALARLRIADVALWLLLLLLLPCYIYICSFRRILAEPSESVLSVFIWNALTRGTFIMVRCLSAIKRWSLLEMFGEITCFKRLNWLTLTRLLKYHWKFIYPINFKSIW